MNPHQQNKVDINSLSPDEQRLLRLYGKVPTRKDLLQNKLKERKYFDSGDYALSKAGKASDVGVTNIGSQHPNPENIPHLTATSSGTNNPAAGNGSSVGSQGQPIPGSISGHPGSVGFSRSPVKEASYLNRRSSVDDQRDADSETKDSKERSASPLSAKSGIPIRR
ncbi:hypothetical protein MPDQ_003855 [Monascus purpureus]|uniref:mRNA stability protein n=1 Tax=Monascus purpureus TaxID=5098 RepID=A0A507QI58_MONPU|nr:hypothetical protein MPDQ_003855 [Monascus purpureus]BDD55030.1 hypothetical protein MAP00_000586 [Monascus purpureus]